MEILRKNIWNFIDKHKEIIFFVIITIFTLLIRSFGIKYISGDMYWDLRSWYEELKDAGGFAGLKNNIGNYNVPYLTILAFLTYLPISYDLGIKIVSVNFDYLLAIGCMILVKKLLKDNPKSKFYSLITYSVVLLLPSTILNSSYWGQCDAIYCTFALFALIFLMDEKYFWSFTFLRNLIRL